MPTTGIWMLALALSGLPGISARWIGQDGHDLAGPWAQVKPSDIQDLHIILEGLPPDRQVAQVVVKTQEGDDWEFGGRPGAWAVVCQRAAGSSRVDLYLEPTRPVASAGFAIKVRLDDGSTDELTLRGGRMQPDLRIPGVRLSAEWSGSDQKAADWTGPGPAVGPDGLVDSCIELRGLSTQIEIKSILIEASGPLRWRFGTNLEGDSNAELVRNEQDRSRAALYFQAGTDLKGRRVRVSVRYESGPSDTVSLVAGSTEPNRRMPVIRLPRKVSTSAKATWMGQDGQFQAEPGAVHAVLENLSVDPPIVAAVLSDTVCGCWVYRSDSPNGGPAAIIEPVDDQGVLQFRPRSDRARADLFFTPVRDESGRGDDPATGPGRRLDRDRQIPRGNL